MAFRESPSAVHCEQFTRESQCRAKHLESADKEKAHGEQSRAAPVRTVPEEIESMKAPPDMKTGRSLHTCPDRGVPADDEARSRVNENKTRDRS